MVGGDRERKQRARGKSRVLGSKGSDVRVGGERREGLDVTAMGRSLQYAAVLRWCGALCLRRVREAGVVWCGVVCCIEVRCIEVR